MKTGVYKEINTSNHKKAKVKSPSPPWFDHNVQKDVSNTTMSKIH